ncbi:MAG: NUDIX domain-containing protein [Trueperaceae bacterium]|nr:NUDIX domain-containing protein [Trueperaceae bacterium]
MPSDFATQTGFDTRVGAYCVLVENDAVLLVHLRTEQFEKGEWTLPGGGVDPLEKPEQAALREVREETGLEVELTGLLAVDSFTERPEDRHAEVDRARCWGCGSCTRRGRWEASCGLRSMGLRIWRRGSRSKRCHSCAESSWSMSRWPPTRQRHLVRQLPREPRL